MDGHSLYSCWRSLPFLCCFAILFVSGCTPLQPQGIEWGYADHCKDVRCVVEEVEVWKGKDVAGLVRMGAMEGYPDSPLLWMYDNGYLTIDTVPFYMHAINIPTGFWLFGLSEIQIGYWGEIYKCHILYTPSPSWRVLIHELSHCKGYKDRYDMTDHYGYTDSQKEVIAKEGVSKWSETAFFKEGKHVGETSIKRGWVNAN